MKDLVGKRASLRVPDEGEESPGVVGGVVGLGLGLVKIGRGSDEGGEGFIFRLDGIARGGVEDDQFVVPMGFGIVGGGRGEEGACLGSAPGELAEGIGGEISPCIADVELSGNVQGEGHPRGFGSVSPKACGHGAGGPVDFTELAFEKIAPGAQAFFPLAEFAARKGFVHDREGLKPGIDEQCTKDGSMMACRVDDRHAGQTIEVGDFDQSTNAGAIFRYRIGQSDGEDHTALDLHCRGAFGFGSEWQRIEHPADQASVAPVGIERVLVVVHNELPPAHSTISTFKALAMLRQVSVSCGVMQADCREA